MTAIFIGLFLGLLVAEVALIGFLEIAHANNSLVVSDPVLHHVHPSNHAFTYADPDKGRSHSHKLRFDENGLLVNPNWSGDVNASNVDRRVAFMGDSFLESFQTPYSESFFGILENSAGEGVTVKNYGCSSYSPVLYFLQWKTQVTRFKPTHVFLLLYANDPRDDLRYFSQAVFDHENEITAVPGLWNSWRKIQLTKYYLQRIFQAVSLSVERMTKKCASGARPLLGGGFSEENPDISPLSGTYVLKLAKEVQASGARLTLMVVPSRCRLEGDCCDMSSPEFSDKWKNWAERHSVDFLDLVGPFQEAARDGTRLFMKRDIHFNSLGHLVIARTLQESHPELFK